MRDHSAIAVMFQPKLLARKSPSIVPKRANSVNTAATRTKSGDGLVVFIDRSG